MELRKKGIIIVLSKPFAQTNKHEVNSFITTSIIIPIAYNEHKYSNIRVFKARIIYKIKDKLSSLYEKSRLVVRGFNDINKKTVFTQSLII